MPASCRFRILPTDSASRVQRFIEMQRGQSRLRCSRRTRYRPVPASEMSEAENGRNNRRRNLGMDMPKKQLVAEALIDLHRRLSALPTRNHERRMIMHKPAKAVKVFSYACKIAYPEEAAHVEHQLTLTHRHRNLLTETLLKGREKYREIIKEHLGLDIKALEEQAKEI